MPEPIPAGHFPRPTTRLNAVVERLLLLFPTRPLHRSGVEHFQRQSIDAFLELGASPEPLERAVRDTRWEIASGRAPADAWGGEVLQGPPPRVVMYRDSPLTRIPSRWVFGIAQQLAVDHMIGHLYEYHRGAEDWGEEVACRWQYRVLKARGGPVNNATAAVVALTHRLHKRISLSNYA